MGSGQTLEQSPLDPRISDPVCGGTGYTDSDHTMRHKLCHGSGLVTRERLQDAVDAGDVTPEEAQPGRRPAEAGAAGQGPSGSPVPGYLP